MSPYLAARARRRIPQSGDGGSRSLQPPSGRRARPLLGKPLVQLTILLVGAAIGGHHLRPYHALRRDHVVQVMLQRPFQHEPLRLPVLLGHGDELLIELGIYFGGDFDGARHGCSWLDSSWVDWQDQDKSRDCYRLRSRWRLRNNSVTPAMVIRK